MFSGKTIPDDLFRGLSRSLRNVNLKGCSEVTSLPESLGELPNLETLVLPQPTQMLFGNTSLPPMITSLPDSLISHSTLTHLECGVIHRELLLGSVCRMSNIENLFIGCIGDLRECPSLVQLSRLTNLEVFRQFTSFPHPLPISLQSLTFRQTPVRCFPSHFSMLTNLSRLQLVQNGMPYHLFSEHDPSSSLAAIVLDAGRPQEHWETRCLAALTPSLRVFEIVGASNIASLPTSISVLTGLRSLILVGHDNWNIIPESLSTLTGLTSFTCSRCSFSTLPPGFSTLISLRELDISNNPFPELPSCIFHFLALEKLNVAGTQVSRLPGEISRLTKLVSLGFKAEGTYRAPPIEVVPTEMIAMCNASLQQEIRAIIRSFIIAKSRSPATAAHL